MHICTQHVYLKSRQYSMSFNVTAVLSLPLGMSTLLHPTLVAMKIILLAAFTALSLIDLKSVDPSVRRHILDHIS